MKSDLDALMLETSLDGVLVTGARMHNPSLTYFVGPAHLTSADLLKKRGQTPVLFCRAMEREEAARTGLPVKVVEDFNPAQLHDQAGGDTARQRALLLERMLAETGLAGRVAVTGRSDLGAGFAALQHLMRCGSRSWPSYPIWRLTTAVARNMDAWRKWLFAASSSGLWWASPCFAC